MSQVINTGLNIRIGKSLSFGLHPHIWQKEKVLVILAFLSVYVAVQICSIQISMLI